MYILVSVVSNSPEQITVVISKTCIILCIPKECYNIFPGLAHVFSSLSDSVVSVILEQIRFAVKKLSAKVEQNNFLVYQKLNYVTFFWDTCASFISANSLVYHNSIRNNRAQQILQFISWLDSLTNIFGFCCF